MPASKRLNIEDEVDDAGFGEETKYFFDGSDSEDSHKADADLLSSLPEDGRLRLRPDIKLEGPQYSGQKSNRNEAYGEDDKKWQLLGEGMERKRPRTTYSDSEDLSGGEINSEGDGDEPDAVQQDDEIEALTKEYTDLREQEANLLKNLKKHADEDIRKGQAVRNQKAIWDKALEIRISLQKVFSRSNQLPQGSLMSSFCKSDMKIDGAYSELVSSAHQTLDCLLDLQEVLLEKNNAINEASFENGKSKSGNEEHQKTGLSTQMDAAWARIETLYTRIAPFRDNSVDKWHRKTQLSAGAAAMKSKFRAFNQSISQQVSTYMKDPTSMMKRMQLMRSSVDVIGTSSQAVLAQEPKFQEKTVEEINEDGDPELLDDSEFYQQLLQEFLESTDPTLLGTSVYSSKKINRKRKVVDRRASKSRKIRYNVHEKIVNFMAPEPMLLPPMAPKLFSNLFGQQNSQTV
ncbi:uncharacterized protein LOC131071369 isoform X2 [Cryptomeria japonica]|uniref:uncharacterized protein LOC131071369 isoform X2 n=1 Tax=Cryptomeria japonica TaxID=3369 RepID=UPI0025ABFB65|nr:uncharacterized protein LOC131071369 isoform X2 [Cryptomeria japonica]